MLGWEFPPHISGGLGTACYGLTKAMDQLGMDLIFLMPQSDPLRFGHTIPQSWQEDLPGSLPESFEHIRFMPVQSALQPYLSASENTRVRSVRSADTGVSIAAQQTAHADRETIVPESALSADYGTDLLRSVEAFTQKAARLAQKESFDLVHAHDWMTYPAAMTAARVRRRPLIVHVHSTEFDRCGENVNSQVCGIEWRGMQNARKVITVSKYTKRMICQRYRIPADKIEVVYNGVEQDCEKPVPLPGRRYANTKYVLFLGRVTMQKGPEYFLHAARLVADQRDDVRFIMAGAGDMLFRMVDLAAKLRLGPRVLFTKFLRGQDVQKAYRLADLYVMPSVSEPFGIAPLEALRHNVPVLISKQSGVSEVLRNALRVEFWDVREMANKIISVLSRPVLSGMLRDEGRRELSKFNWETSARTIRDIYYRTLVHS
jgi:glycosyltransferase involved in cell wall biosynthesis